MGVTLEGDAGVTGEGDSRVTGRVTPMSPLESQPEKQRSDDLFESARDAEREIFLRALAAYPETGAKVTDEGSAMAEWAAALREVGQGERLEAAVVAYAADPDLARRQFGAPSMQRWLRERRFRRWLPEGDGARALAVAASASASRIGGRFPEAPIREAFVAATSEASAVSYLDPCGWEPEGRRLLPRTQYAADWLSRHARAVVADLGLTIIDPAPRSIP